MADQITGFLVLLVIHRKLTQISSRYSIHPPTCEFDITATDENPRMGPAGNIV